MARNLKDSILSYAEAKGMLPRQDQDIMDMTISEEKKRLSELTYVANGLMIGTWLCGRTRRNTYND